jgi:hypothetical protein
VINKEKEMLRKTTLLVLAAILLLGAAAQAQVTYQITSTPTFVINTGRAEVLGSVRITALNTGPTVASTIQVLYQAVACDNTFASGVEVVAGNPAGVIPGGAFANPAPPAPQIITGQNVANSSAGCIVSFTVAGGQTVAVGDFIEIRGVRGRVDMLGGLANIGTNVLASLNATPAGSSLFTAPTTVVVATTAVGLVVGPFGPVTRLNCVGGLNPTIQVQEGFNAAFVQWDSPANARPAAGANNNTQIRIQLTGLPSGVTVGWQATVAVAPAAVGSSLVLLPGSTSSVATYDYRCPDQAVCDINQETFTLQPTVTVALGAAFGTATIQARLFPDLITGDATLITDAPAGVAAPRPRFNDPLRPIPGAAFITSAPCATNLLFPFVVEGGGFDTGIAIANTSLDPFGTFSATAQAGTCTLTGWPAATGTPSVTFTTPSVAAGASWVSSMSTVTPFQGFVGYIIARCNFQFAHGYAFISDLGLNTFAQGYLALVIPDPIVMGTPRNARPPQPGINEIGEGLGQ